MGRERAEFKRIGLVRDVQQLFVIATEGEMTEQQYLEELKAHCSNKNIYIEVLIRRNTGSSSPRKVIEQLNEFKRQYHLTKNDQFWMLVDRDRWEIKEIAEVAKLSSQKRFGFALSNPCFEFWLLLHRKDLDEYSLEEQKMMLENRRLTIRTWLETELVQICGSYSKSKLRVDDFFPTIDDAISRARKLDESCSGRWPENELGTHVYKLVEKLRN